MKTINIKGDIITDDMAIWYRYFGWNYMSPNKMENELANANGDEVVFLINSGGGSVFDGYDIFNAIKDYKGKTTAKIVGVAASAASFIAMAADKVQACALSQMMIHRAANANRGNAPSHHANGSFLEGIDNTIVKAYTMRNGKTDEEMVELMDKTTWLTPEQAKENGIVDEIVNDTIEKPLIVNGLEDGKLQVITQLFGTDKLENIKKIILENQNNDQGVVNKATIDKTKNKEENEVEITNVKDLQENYGALCNELVENAQKEAVENERKRISDIYALARPGVEDQIKKGVEDGLTAGEVAINILNAQSEKGKKTLENMKKDAENSGLGAVATETPQNTEQDDQKASINLLAEAGKNIMGGTR